MNKLKVCFTAKNYYMWGGGIDFIATIAQGIENSDKTESYLLIKKDSFVLELIKRLLFFLKSKGSYKEFKKKCESYEHRYDNLINTFKECSPNTQIISYIGSYIDDNKKIMQNMKKYGVKILIAHNGFFTKKTPLPWIGYMYDFQHEYLKHLFSEKELMKRRKEIGKRLRYSDHIIVNSEDTKKDIKKFYPNCDADIFVLPFAPFQKLELDKNFSLEKYRLPERYYIISNQFWKHKDHKTAFEALEEIYIEGYKEIHLVCTGKLEDERDQEYVDTLLDRLNKMQCRKNIHILGYIPKKDQINIMSNSIGLIQPTLFEGGPGGGSVYNALCLGKPCLVSDINVNREIKGYRNVYFFEKENSTQLGNLMVEHCMDKSEDGYNVEMQINKNKHIYTEALLTYIDGLLK